MACLRITVIPIQQANFAVSVIQQASLMVSEVCSVSNGELTVLAASDGPLRTRDGGYILLDPSRELPDSSSSS